MRKIREILRLRAAGKSHRQIGLSVGIGQSTVGDYLTRARLAGVSWPIALDDVALERALYPPRPPVPSAERGEPDWAEVHRELKRKGVTLFLLWEEYKSTHPNGSQYLMSIECRQSLPGTNSPQSEPILHPNIHGAHCYRDGDGLNLVEHDSLK